MSPIVLLCAGIGAAFVLFVILTARPRLSVTAASTAAQRGDAVIIDVREPAAWRSGVAAPAALLPASDLRGAREKWRPFLEQHRDQRLLVYCFSGTRSGLVAAQLRREGFNAVNLGSFHRWVAAGLPVRQPEDESSPT